MGLDMYLKAEKYVGGWDYSTDEEKKNFNQILQAVKITDLVTPDAPGITVRTNVAYWRKANAIHAWFVRELAKGVDECQEIYVSAEDMKRLLDDCQEALRLYHAGEVKAAGEKMSPQGGFFFGTTTVDEWWEKDLENTIEQLEPLVDKEFDFFYQASW